MSAQTEAKGGEGMSARYYVTWLYTIFTSVEADSENDARRLALPDLAEYGVTENDLAELTVELVGVNA